jgi:acyl-coenzyme A thioesterase PaaI-like protein
MRKGCKISFTEIFYASMRAWLPYQPACPVCGDPAVNPRALGFRFSLDLETKEVFCHLRWDPHDWGFVGRVHGGLVAMALDEAMAWACAALRRTFCVTGELKVRLPKPIPSGEELILWAQAGETWGNFTRARAQLRQSNGEVLASATASFAALPREESVRLKQFLVFRPGDVDVLAEHLRPSVPGDEGAA